MVMYSTNFYTVKTNGQEIIRDHKSELQIKVYNISELTFTPNPQEITLYGTNRHTMLAFETVNNKKFGIELTAYALSWYVDYSGQYDIKISREDPRHRYSLKRA